MPSNASPSLGEATYIQAVPTRCAGRARRIVCWLRDVSEMPWSAANRRQARRAPGTVRELPGHLPRSRRAGTDHAGRAALLRRRGGSVCGALGRAPRPLGLAPGLPGLAPAVPGRSPRGALRRLAPALRTSAQPGKLPRRPVRLDRAPPPDEPADL